MAHSTFRPDHVWLIALYQLRFALRTGAGLVFLFIFLTAGLIVASIFLTPVEGLLRSGLGGEADAAQLVNEIARSDAMRSSVKWAAGTSEAQTTYLLEQNPAVLSCIFILLLVLLPYLIIIGASNQTGGDIQSRGLRYLLVRTERVNIFYGRFLGAFCLTAISTFFLVVLVAVYLQLKLGIYNLPNLIVWSFQGWLALLLFSLPFIALCAWISSALGSAFSALAISLVIVGFSAMFFAIARMQLEARGKSGEYAWLDKLLPGGWKYDLLSSDLVSRLLAILAMAGFTALFLFLGQRNFAKRDL